PSIGPTRGGEAMEELDSPYRRVLPLCRPSRWGAQSQEIIGMKTSPKGDGSRQFNPESAARPLSGLNFRFSFGRRLHADIFLAWARSYAKRVACYDNPSGGPWTIPHWTGNVFPIVAGAFGEVNEDASKLITNLARLTAETDFGKSMSPLAR
ncbi:hypothetical protein THAOC_10207, partial [Thalassiosira oceanica]